MPTPVRDSAPLALALFGAAGRMGQALIRCAARSPAWRVVAAVEAPDCPLIGTDAGRAAGGPDLGVALAADARAAARPAAVLIDFSAPAAAARHAALAAELGRPMVIGTTGLNAAESDAVRRAAERIAVVWAPNMSVGVTLLCALVEQAARLLADYDLEIVELHHRHKRDAPSGTALCLAETAAAARGVPLEAVAAHGRHGLTGERPPGQIGLHALRGGDAVGEHTVLLAGSGERIELTHRASSRDCFAEGALRAAAWVAAQPPGLYGMRDVLGGCA